MPQEWDEAKKQQDKRLERIEAGVVELGDMARNIGERAWLLHCFAGMVGTGWSYGKKHQRDTSWRGIATGIDRRELAFGCMASSCGCNAFACKGERDPTLPLHYAPVCLTAFARTCSHAGEEVDRQNPIIDDIEQQMDKVTNNLKTNNQKLQGVLKNMRSSRNFCVDIILITVLLAIGAYIYAMFM